MPLSSIARAMLGAAAGLAGLVGYSYLIEPFWLEIIRHDVVLPSLPSTLDGLVLAQLSDFHLRGSRRDGDALDQAIRQCNRANPDLIVMTGDYLGERRGLS